MEVVFTAGTSGRRTGVNRVLALEDAPMTHYLSRIVVACLPGTPTEDRLHIFPVDDGSQLVSGFSSEFSKGVETNTFFGNSTHSFKCRCSWRVLMVDASVIV